MSLSGKLGQYLAVSIMLGGMLLPQSAFPFGAVQFAGQNAEHEKITRIALSKSGFGEETMDLLAGKRNSLGAVGAPDSPERGLMDKAHAHCDGGDFLPVPGYPQTREQAYAKLVRCRAFAFQQLAKAIKSAGRIADDRGRVNTREIASFIPCTFNGKSGRAKCEVLDALGIAFHAAQDFYAHTNWVDIPGDGGISPDNPPGLGNDGRSPWFDPRRNEGYINGLISGCFEGKPERLHCEYGDDQDRVRHRMLNKDLGQIVVATGKIGKGVTPRGRINRNFRRAVLAAIADTRDKWNYFRQMVVKTYVRSKAKPSFVRYLMTTKTIVIELG